jgi:hypothetical protein
MACARRWFTGSPVIKRRSTIGPPSRSIITRASTFGRISPRRLPRSITSMRPRCRSVTSTARTAVASSSLRDIASTRPASTRAAEPSCGFVNPPIARTKASRVETSSGIADGVGGFIAASASTTSGICDGHRR